MDSPARTGPVPLGPLDSKKLLYQFDQAWQSGEPPRIEAFLAQASGPTGRQLLDELIQIDLGYRWRHGLRLPGPQTAKAASAPSKADCPRLEDYVQRHPELGPLEEVTVDLIEEEYWVRRRWGDQPGHDEYLRRFPKLAGQLPRLLARVDAELAAEFARAAKGMPGPATGEPGALATGALTAARARPIDSVTTLLATLRQQALLDPQQCDELQRLSPRFAEPRALAQELLRRNWLTAYQVNQLLQGRGRELLVGPYLILERLGEGGAGQVFKARHQKMGRVAALKLIRKELLADAEVVGRFYREIQVLSQLDHPNVVHAYDAGPVPGGVGGSPIPATHFLAMEYVEGTDLGRLVKQGGPMPVLQACAYVRQAALGLQHAHERGLVHRDIKPHNLIMSLREGQIKVADLGLARLPRTLGPEATAALGKGTGTLTPENAVLIGTADYLAPEQALDFHTADIRADIYSLGCTFYYLLTGQPPFAGVTLAEKLLKHQQVEPRPVEQFRADLPDGLSVVLRTMLAKRVEDRYRSPADVAAALAPFCQPGSSVGPPGRLRRAWRRGARSRVLVAGILAALLGLVVIALLLRGPALTPAQAALKELRAQQKDPKADIDRLRQGILKLRLDHPGTPEANQAAVLLTELPSPLDLLDQAKIAAEDRPKDLSSDAVAIFSKRGQPLRGVAFSPDATVLAAWGEGKRVHLWHLRSAVKEGHLEDETNITALAFAPDGKASATTGGDGSVKIWQGGQSKTLGPQNALTTLAFSPDGQTLAWTTERGVCLWDVASAKERARLPQQGVSGIAFSPDARTVAVASYSGPVKLWEVATGKEESVVPLGAESLAYAPDGRALAFGCHGGPVKLWEGGRFTLENKDDFHCYARWLAFTPDGKSLIRVVSDGTITVLDVPAGRTLATWKLSEEASGAALAADGRHLAVATGRVWIFRLPSVRGSRSR